MPGNQSLVEHIIEKLAPHVDDKGGLDQIRSTMLMLDQLGGEAVGAQLGEMLASVERAIEGIEANDGEAALKEADRWGIRHLVESALKHTPAIEADPSGRMVLEQAGPSTVSSSGTAAEAPTVSTGSADPPITPFGASAPAPPSPSLPPTDPLGLARG